MATLTWKKLASRFASLPAQQKVSLVKTLERGQEEAVFEGLLPLGDEIFEPLEAAVKKLFGLRSYLTSASFEPGLYAVLLHRRGETPPEAIDPFIASCFNAAASSRPHLGPVIRDLPEERRAKVCWLATSDFRPLESTQALAEHVGPGPALAGLVARMEAKQARWWTAHEQQSFRQAFHGIGPERWAQARARLDGKVSTREARFLVHVTEGQRPEADIAALLVELLAHGNTGVRAEARSAIEGQLAEHAALFTPALQAGSESRKKSQREACGELLALAKAGGAGSEALPDPLPRLFAELDSLGPNAAIRRGGALALLAERAHCSLHGSYWEWARRLRDAGSSDDAAWVAVFLLSELPAGGRKWTLARYRDEMSTRYKARMLPALRWALTAREPAHAGTLYELLAEHEGERVHAEVWLPALDATLKGPRELAIQQLGKLEPSLAERLLPLLSSRRKATREATARLLAHHPPADPAPLREALEAEEDLDVAQALRAALEALAPEQAPGAADPTDEASLLARLSEVRRKRLPKWLDPGALPPLRLRSGALVAGDALRGLLALLSLEGPDQHDPGLAAARGLFEARSAAAWSLAVRDAWQAATSKSYGAARRDRATGPAAQKWAVFQEAFFMDEARIEALREFLAGPWASENHSYVEWLLTALERQGSPAAVDVIIERAVTATRDKERRQARALLEALAKQQGQRPITLVQASSLCRPRVQREPADRRLDMDGGVALDYGPRGFLLRVLPGGALGLFNADGTPRDSLPRAAKGDDPDKVKAAKKLYAEARSGAQSVLEADKRRLEGQLRSGERWSAPQVRRLLLDHPVMGMLAQGVVFRSSKGALVRPAGATLIDVEGAPYALAEDETLAVVHPLELENAQLDAWIAHLDAAGVPQPFPQLRREYRLASAHHFERAEDIHPVRFQKAAEAAGWEPGPKDEYGAVDGSVMVFLSRGVKARLEHGAVGPWITDPISVDRLRFTDLLDRDVKPQDVDPIAFSEALLAAERVG